MAKYKLTDIQKHTLELLVNAYNEGKLRKIVSVVTFSGEGILEVDGYKGNNIEGDLNAIYEEGLIGFDSFSKSADPIYSLRQLGIEAVENDFEKPEPSPTAQSIITTNIGSISGGNFQIVGYSKNSKISQKFETKADFESEIDKVIEQITEVVKQELNQELLPYLKELEELKNELKAEKPDESKLKPLLNTLGFFGNIEGSISLIFRVWPLLLSLLQMVLG